MRALHIRLISVDPSRADVVELLSQLRGAGHVVVTSSDERPDEVSAIPDFVLTESATVPAAESLESAEARHIAAMLRFTRGNKRQTALLLGVARSTLLAKIRRYGLH